MPGPENRAGRPPEEEWPDPTVEEPELADLEGWEAEGGCEATDGCWVSVEGVCRHGHPSWQLWLGLC